ncbi:indolepyruvate oxidoreductase subunit beta family protein [Alcaligenes sp. Marseille-Q7550]
MQMKPIKIAILAMGGEGGGVLADWIVNLGEHNGYFAQTTSVPGVAQRTGATTYYVELFPREAAPAGKTPVLALMPMPGDVDVVLASELMEAGRAVQRGLVTNDRTTLIASTHRVYSIAEKSAMGDGRVDNDALIAHATQAAKRFVHFNMEKAAEDSGSVISAVMFGALASTGVLPFSRSQFEQTIERGGVGVKPSLKAFSAAYARVAEGDAGKDDQAAPAVPVSQLKPRDPAVARLVERVRAEIPEGAQQIVVEGVRRVLDYQDVAYANLYLDRLKQIRQYARPDDVALIRETGRYLALWMSYEDAIRVAELKTRATRFDRVRKEVRATDGQIVAINEYMHPRVEEISEILPFAGLGRWLMRPTWGNKLLKTQTKSGRVIQTSSVRGFIPLYLLSGFKRWRRRTLRYQAEQQRIEAWLKRIQDAADAHPALALEIAQCQRLVKGYGDTHARGLRNYQTVMDALARNETTMSPALLGALREAALADEHGKKLEAALRQNSLV